MRARIVSLLSVLLALAPSAPAGATPAPGFTHTPAVVGRPVTFVADPASCDTSYCSYLWRHVNGTRYGARIGEGVGLTSVEYVFSKAGVTAVSLTVTNNTNCRRPGPSGLCSASVTRSFTVAAA
jgi:hypothetical protein